MPYINGKYYMNPSYGRGLEHVRHGGGDVFDAIAKSINTGSVQPILEAILGGTESSDQDNHQPETPPVPKNGVVPVSQLYADQQHGDVQSSAQHEPRSRADNSTDGRWVTINGRHVFIQESSGDWHQHTKQTAVLANQQKRKEIADVAKEYNHSTAWAFDKKKDDFPAGSNKCNKFVYDVTKEAGAKAAVKGSDGKARPPLAGEWADAHTAIPHWRVLGPNETPQPGDVAAWPFHYSDATGHTGIVTSVDRNGHVTAMAAHEAVVGPDSSFNPSPVHPKVTYRRYTGE